MTKITEFSSISKVQPLISIPTQQEFLSNEGSSSEYFFIEIIKYTSSIRDCPCKAFTFIEFATTGAKFLLKATAKVGKIKPDFRLCGKYLAQNNITNQKMRI